MAGYAGSSGGPLQRSLKINRGYEGDVRTSACAVNLDDTRRGGFPIRVGSGADRGRRQAGPNEAVSRRVHARPPGHVP